MHKSTQEVLNHHLESFSASNMDEVLDDYTEDSILVDIGMTYKGPKEIQQFFEWLLDALPPGSAFKMKKMEVIGEYAYIAWSAASKTTKYELGTDTFHIVNGKIKYQLVAAYGVRK